MWQPDEIVVTKEAIDETVTRRILAVPGRSRPCRRDQPSARHPGGVAHPFLCRRSCRANCSGEARSRAGPHNQQRGRRV